MNVLVTGGTGFIGRAVVAALKQRGDQVWVVSRDVERARRQLPPGVSIVGDLRSLAAADCDAVIHLAGENLGGGRWTAARKQAFRDSRIGMLERLRAWLEPAPCRPQVLISASAIGWYGDRGDDVLDERVAAGDDFGARLCRDWEAAAQGFTELGLRVCTTRFGVVLHAEGGALPQMLPAFRLGLGGPIGNGRQWLSWIARDDAVALLLWLLDDSQRAGAYNAVAPQPVMQREFARALGRALHRVAVMPMPAAALRLMFGEMADLLLISQRVVPRRALDEGFVFRYAGIDAALAAALAR